MLEDVAGDAAVLHIEKEDLIEDFLIAYRRLSARSDSPRGTSLGWPRLLWRFDSLNGFRAGFLTVT